MEEISINEPARKEAIRLMIINLINKSSLLRSSGTREGGTSVAEGAAGDANSKGVVSSGLQVERDEQPPQLPSSHSIVVVIWAVPSHRNAVS